MKKQRLLLTGFGPFGSIQQNPSSLLLPDLQRYLGFFNIEVTGLVLPVSFQQAPQKITQILDSQTVKFDLMLGMGLHRGTDFRFETRARPVPVSRAIDIDGNSGKTYTTPVAHELLTAIPADKFVRDLTAVWPWIRVSENASGYVCEAVYHYLLYCGQKNNTPCAFIHIPDFRLCHKDMQIFLLSRLVQTILSKK